MHLDGLPFIGIMLMHNMFRQMYLSGYSATLFMVIHLLGRKVKCKVCPNAPPKKLVILHAINC